MVDRKTVEDLRVDLEFNLRIPKLTHLIGKDGKKRPREMPRRVD